MFGRTQKLLRGVGGPWASSKTSESLKGQWAYIGNSCLGCPKHHFWAGIRPTRFDGSSSLKCIRSSHGKPCVFLSDNKGPMKSSDQKAAGFRDSLLEGRAGEGESFKRDRRRWKAGGYSLPHARGPQGQAESRHGCHNSVTGPVTCGLHFACVFPLVFYIKHWLQA